ncbi:glycosyltransferase family 4 protein [Brevibacillus panacihumi]|uniref:glycosyltransferase family 4 protein n=1 Tax=Brevibacillus panacihumi TaxID=497735 RepID=UPI003D082ED3
MQTMELIRNYFIQKHISKMEKWRKSVKQEYSNVWNTDFPLDYSSTGPLKITYVMNHVRVCGGAKIVLEQANHLVDRNHEVSIVCRAPKPDWMEVKANYIQVSLQSEIPESIPDSDIIICTVVDQVLDCYLSRKAPVVLFEQGDTYLFEFSKLEKQMQDSIKNEWSIPVPVISVSKGLSTVIEKHFHKRCLLLPNAIDSRHFFPKGELKLDKKVLRVLMVGQTEVKFKGIDKIIEAVGQVRQNGREVELVWVSQTKPSISFDGELFINPSQKELGEVYRSCDIYVSASEYESFCLPALEAMSSGCAVISTNHAGIQEYGIHEENCLIADIGDTSKIADYITRLIDFPLERMKLVNNGYKTAREFEWETTINKLETYIHSVTTHWRKRVETVNHMTSLRIETVPSNLSRVEAIETINLVQQSMQEEWCLWLMDGETISPQNIERMEQMIGEPIDNLYSLQIVYSNDVPEHPIIRKENRLLRKGESFTFTPELGEHIPIRIENASATYFTSEWLDTVRRLYKDKEFIQSIDFIKRIYSKLDYYEQPVAIKWLVLSMMELQAFQEATKVLNDAIKVYGVSSDLQYLYARIALLLGNNDLAVGLLQLTKETGTAFLLSEYFEAIHSTADQYLNILLPTE